MTDGKFERLTPKEKRAFIKRKEDRNLLRRKHAAEQWEIVSRKVFHSIISLLYLTVIGVRTCCPRETDTKYALGSTWT